MLTLLFLLFAKVFVYFQTVPVLYETYEDKVVVLAENAMATIKKQYAAFNAKVVSKMPTGLMNKYKRD